jgi:ATP-binding cassette, subfamily B, bacterial
MAKRSTFKSMLGYYWMTAKRYPVALSICVFLATTGPISGAILAPYFTSELIDALSNFGEVGVDQQITNNLIWLTITTMVHFLGWRIFGYIFIPMQARSLRDLEQFVFSRLMRHSYQFFANRFSGSLVTQSNRFIRSYETLQDALFFDIYTLLIRIVFSSVILVVVAPLIGVTFIVWSLVLIASIIFLSTKKLPITKHAATKDSKVTGALADSITNVLSVKVFSRGKFEQNKFNSVSKERYGARHRSWMIDEHIRSYQSIVNTFVGLLVIYLAVYLVRSGALDIGIVVLAVLYVGRLSSDLFSLSGVIRRTESAISDAMEMTEILDLPLDVADPVKPMRSKISKGLIEYRDVDFEYPDDHKIVFENFNLSIKPGERVGLVGRSGSGKSTLVKTLLRFADVSGGLIKIDGQNIAKLRQDDVRSAIAYVPQEPILFHRSLTDNISYGQSGATQKDIERAAKQAHAHQFIETLPKGYETLVGERGIKLSGGEKQRIAIARAILKQAPILVLDEATSALDSESELLIQEALWKLMENRTTIVIAHRLSTIQQLDRIIVLDKGKIIESGTHDQLVNKNGEYAKLWSHQSGGFLSE